MMIRVFLSTLLFAGLAFADVIVPDPEEGRSSLVVSGEVGFGQAAAVDTSRAGSGFGLGLDFNAVIPEEAGIASKGVFKLVLRISRSSRKMAVKPT